MGANQAADPNRRRVSRHSRGSGGVGGVGGAMSGMDSDGVGGAIIRSAQQAAADSFAQGRASFSPLVSNVHRGLQNGIGENNCFLNVTIQALWHLGPFRVELKKLLSSLDQGSEGPPTLEQAAVADSILSAVSNLFVQYEFAELSTLPPTQLRTMLHRLTDK
jgi:hypothetical protein